MMERSNLEKQEKRIWRRIRKYPEIKINWNKFKIEDFCWDEMGVALFRSARRRNVNFSKWGDFLFDILELNRIRERLGLLGDEYSDDAFGRKDEAK